MAQITLNIPDAVVPRVLDAVAAQYGYDPAQGQTKTQFAKQVLSNIIKDAVKEHEATPLAQQAISNNNADVDQNVVIT